MMTDRTTKALLLAIALGLWANMAADWLKPVAVQAQSAQLRNIESDLSRIARGLCLNSKIC